MKARQHCARQWEAEAIRDGRVSGPERQSFEAHSSRCRTCREYADELEACAQRLKELPSGLPDAFTLRRQRLELLEQYNELLVVPARRSLRAPALVSLGIIVTIVALVFSRQRSVSNRWIEMRVAAPGTWNEIRQGNSERVLLHDGHFELAIHRPSAASRVLLVLPDGEIEDLGTALEVWISEGQTRRVSVRSGEVVMRLHGSETTHLRAGEQWRSDDRLTASASSSASREAPNASSANTSLQSPPGSAPGHARPQKPTATASTAPSSAGPISGRVTEDSAYLRVLDLLDRGRNEQAKLAADAYLAEYPHGFRRLEILNIEKRLKH